jgi:hypothetical protein
MTMAQCHRYGCFGTGRCEEIDRCTQTGIVTGKAWKGVVEGRGQTGSLPKQFLLAYRGAICIKTGERPVHAFLA